RSSNGTSTAGSSSSSSASSKHRASGSRIAKSASPTGFSNWSPSQPRQRLLPSSFCKRATAADRASRQSSTPTRSPPWQPSISNSKPEPSGSRTLNSLKPSLGPPGSSDASAAGTAIHRPNPQDQSPSKK